MLLAAGLLVLVVPLQIYAARQSDRGHGARAFACSIDPREQNHLGPMAPENHGATRCI
jgi:hypothetical protein